MYLRADHVTKTYRTGFTGQRLVHALKGVNLEIGQPGVYGLVGPNGAGKSTLIKLLVGLTRPTSGFVSLGGEPPLLPRARKSLAYLSEVPSLPAQFTPEELVQLTASLMEVSMSANETGELLEKVDLAAVSRRRVATFSKGMRQRLALALCWVGRPKVLILDEPMSGLDPIGRVAVKQMIKTWGEEGATVLYSSHVLSDVEEICPQVFVMAEGEIRQRGSLAELAPYKEGLEVVYRQKGATTIEKTSLQREELLGWLQANQEQNEVLEVRPIRDTLEELLLKVVAQ